MVREWSVKVLHKPYFVNGRPAWRISLSVRVTLYLLPMDVRAIDHCHSGHPKRIRPFISKLNFFWSYMSWWTLTMASGLHSFDMPPDESFQRHSRVESLATSWGLMSISPIKVLSKLLQYHWLWLSKALISGKNELICQLHFSTCRFLIVNVLGTCTAWLFEKALICRACASNARQATFASVRHNLALRRISILWNDG